MGRSDRSNPFFLLEAEKSTSDATQLANVTLAAADWSQALSMARACSETQAKRMVILVSTHSLDAAKSLADTFLRSLR